MRHQIRYLLPFLLLTTLSLAVPGRGLSQAAFDAVSSVKEIPRDNFKTWSLFLVCKDDWASSNKENGFELYNLYLQYEKFGKAIGDDNLAVWFWKRSQPVDSALAANIDQERSRRFCEAYKLDPHKGPYLVVTSTYPDESHLPTGLPANTAVFSLGNMKPDQLSALLDQVGKQLLQKQGTSSDTAATASATWTVRLLESVQQVLTSFGCAWSFKIDAGPVNADLHPCKG
jgi:hypothetical protein